MLYNDSESTVVDNLSSMKISPLNELNSTWQKAYLQAISLGKDESKAVDSSSTLVGYDRRYKNFLNSKPLTEEEFCKIMADEFVDIAKTRDIPDQPNYTTLIGKTKQEITDIPNPPVTSIFPNEYLTVSTDTFYMLTPNIGISKEKLDYGFTDHINLNDQSQIKDKAFISPTADTLDKKEDYKTMDVFNSIFENDEWPNPVNCHSYKYEFIGPFHSKEELMDYMMDHINKFDNDALDQLSYRIAKEKVYRINNDDGTKK